MKCTASHVLSGPNIYSRHPVIRCTLDGASAAPIAPLPSLTAKLFALLPGLREQRPPCDVEALLQPGNRDPARIPHLFEHLAIELQNLSGAELGCVRAEGAGIPPGDAVIPCEYESVGIEAGNVSLALVGALSSTALPSDFERRVQTFLRWATRQRPNAQDVALIRAAAARDIPVIPIVGRFIQLGYGSHQRRVNGTETTRTSVVSNDFAANKDYTRKLFQAVGLPVPAYERVYRSEEAVAAARRIGFPVVLKPNSGSMGDGVSVGLKTEREVRDAFARARELGRSALVEQFIRGTDYRMLVINGKLEAAAKRVPAHVVGDGVHTVRQLVRRANQDPRRDAGQRGSWTSLEFDEQSDRLLAELAYDRNSIPRPGEVVYLKRVANTSAGGTAVDVTDQVHPENREIAERAAMAIGLDIAGVDLLVENITQPLRAQGGVICEINSRPGIRKHLWPAEGQPRDVIGPILEMLFPPGSRSRTPIAVVTGLGDTRRTARMLADLLGADGSIVGMAVDDGVFIGGKRVDGGGMKAPAAVRLLLLDPTVQVAVIQMPPKEALLHGLGYDWADACAILNDQVTQQPDLIAAMRLVVGSARSHVVLSVADQERYGLKPHPGARVWHMSADGRPLAVGDLAVGLEHGRGGLYAAAVAWCLGRQPADIQRTLASLPRDAS